MKLTYKTIHDQKDNCTLLEYLEYWLATLDSVLEKNTVEYYFYGIKTLSQIDEIHTPLRCVTPGLFRTLVMKSPTDAIKVRTKKTLQSSMRYAYEYELIPNNPFTGTTIKIAKSKPFRDAYSAQEAALAIKAVYNHKCEIAVLLALYCGLRREEIIGLDWEDIDLEAGCIHIHHAVVAVGKAYAKGTKTRSSERYVCIGGYGLSRIKELKQGQTGAIFKGRSVENRLHPDTLTKMWKRVIADNNLRYLRFENLRHTFATLASESLVPIKYISEQLGHTSTSTTAIYIPCSTDISNIASQGVSKLLDENLFNNI